MWSENIILHEPHFLQVMALCRQHPLPNAQGWAGLHLGHCGSDPVTSEDKRHRASAFFLFKSLALGKAICHVMRTFKFPVEARSRQGTGASC